jgi:hypothetical protein
MKFDGWGGGGLLIFVGFWGLLSSRILVLEYMGLQPVRLYSYYRNLLAYPSFGYKWTKIMDTFHALRAFRNVAQSYFHRYL